MRTVLLQNGADPNIRNTDGKTALDLADPPAKQVLSGEYKKDELLEASRSGNEEKMMSLLTPLNVNGHASDGRRVSPPVKITPRTTRPALDFILTWE